MELLSLRKMFSNRRAAFEGAGQAIHCSVPAFRCKSGQRTPIVVYIAGGGAMNFLLIGCSLVAAFLMQKDALAPLKGDIFGHLENVRIELLRYESAHHRRTAIWLAIGEAAPADLIRGLDAALRTEGRWTPQANPNGSLETRWTLIDKNGKTWHAVSSVSPFSGQKDIHTVRLEIRDR